MTRCNEIINHILLRKENRKLGTKLFLTFRETFDDQFNQNSQQIITTIKKQKMKKDSEAAMKCLYFSTSIDKEDKIGKNQNGDEFEVRRKIRQGRVRRRSGEPMIVYGAETMRNQTGRPENEDPKPDRNLILCLHLYQRTETNVDPPPTINNGLFPPSTS